MRLSLSSYSIITDSELDGVMGILVRDYPQNGVVMMWGHLRSISIFVTRKRVYDSLTRVSPERIQHRRSTTISGSTVYPLPIVCNRAETVLHLFNEAVAECGWPSRVRSDKGENIDVALVLTLPTRYVEYNDFKLALDTALKWLVA